MHVIRLIWPSFLCLVFFIMVFIILWYCWINLMNRKLYGMKICCSLMSAICAGSSLLSTTTSSWIHQSSCPLPLFPRGPVHSKYRHLIMLFCTVILWPGFFFTRTLSALDTNRWIVQTVNVSLNSLSSQVASPLYCTFHGRRAAQFVVVLS